MSAQKSIHQLFQHYVRYNLWANQRLAQDFEIIGDLYTQTLPVSFGSLQKLLSHLHYYEAKIYKKMTLDLSQTDQNFKNAQDFFQALNHYSECWLKWLEGLEKNAENIQDYLIPLTALYNHNIYHRSQMISALNFSGYKTRSLDVYLFLEGQETDDAQ